MCGGVGQVFSTALKNVIALSSISDRSCSGDLANRTFRSRASSNTSGNAAAVIRSASGLPTVLASARSFVRS